MKFKKTFRSIGAYFPESHACSFNTAYVSKGGGDLCEAPSTPEVLRTDLKNLSATQKLRQVSCG